MGKGTVNIDRDEINKEIDKEVEAFPYDSTADQLYNFIIAKAAMPFNEAEELMHMILPIS